MIHTLPSGLQVDLRKWKLRERKIAKNPTFLRQGTVITKILESVTEGVVNYGPYQESHLSASKGKMSWEKVAWSDTVTAIVGSRADTRDRMVFSQPCIFCKTHIPVDEALSSLRRTSMSPEGIKHLQSGEPLICYVGLDDETSTAHDSEEQALAAGISKETLVVCGVRLLRASDMNVVRKLQKQDPEGDLELMQTCVQIEKLSTPTGHELDDYDSIKVYMEDKGLNIDSAITDFVDKHSGGISTVFERVCTGCSTEQRIILPFGLEFFMM